MSQRKTSRRHQASRRIYYHLALRDTEVRPMRRAVPSIYPKANKDSEPPSATLVGPSMF
ncbi:MAG: hypothetical protein ACI906_005001 [Candidatus Latescibacterota bacterium]|jgi:hypothetical protein